MKAIRNSKLFPILTLLCLCLTSFTWAVELLTVLGVVAAVASIIALIAYTADKINDAIKNRKKKLGELKADLKKLEGKIKKSRAKGKVIQKDIDELDPIVQALITSEYNAYLAYDAASQATKAAETSVKNTSQAYQASYKAWNDHVHSCSYCQSGSDCNTEYILFSQKQSAWWDWEYAKRRLGTAQADENEKSAAWKTESDKLNKERRKLSDLYQDKKDHVEAHAQLLEDEKTLNDRIEDKKESILDAETDLENVGDSDTAAQDYMDSLNAAEAAGEDMDQWVNDNPPPDSLKQVTDILSKYSD